MPQIKKFIIIGLDCLAPQLVNSRFVNQLDFFNKLKQSSRYGTLRSTIPAITVPAWMTMMTSQDPGQLGIYGFRNRGSYDYNDQVIANSTFIKKPLLWDILGEAGLKSTILNVPQTYPPKPIKGNLVGCFLTPDLNSDFTYPKELKKELLLAVPDYQIDVNNFRTQDKEWLIKEIYKMTKARFKAAKFLLESKEWDFFMAVFMGPDRLHHGFWKYFDEEHPLYKPDSILKNVVEKYYISLDKNLEELLNPYIDNEEIAIFIVSDHGAKAMKGGFYINEWLMQEGYLKLIETPKKALKISHDIIDWDNTYCYGEGGYYSRIFLNIAGREPRGIIKENQKKDFLEELKKKLEAILDDNGICMNNKAYLPDEIYHETNGIPPDIILYLGDLSWRSQGTVGTSRLYTHENDTGPDDANHAQDGFFLLYHPGIGENWLDHQAIYHIAPTVLEAFGIKKPNHYLGTSFWKSSFYEE
ncbi:MAG: alkaline phosphatase family protein [Candidatus Coatesbacteria bacterium]|nr:alkaline phosphatase family protein [Candidatus Coatesbacteria bacterium]